MKNKFDFAADCITVNGKTFPARYEVTAAAVNVFATVTEDGKEKTVCICIEAGNELYGPAALAAVKEAPEAQQTEEAQQAEPEAQQAEPEAQQTEEAQAEPEAQQTEEAQAAPEAEQAAPEAEQTAPEAEQTAPEAEQTAPEAEQAEPEAQQTEEAQAAPEAEQTAPDPKATRGPVPEKTFVGQSITGAGWAIIFDGAHNRTRVIISKGNHDKLRGIVESAGFYYSASMDSWNRKLTFRAYRAAQALAQELTAALAA